ncbi:lipoprotein-anchoring transpeptidase ErfK/SrfK [Streptomyces sp. PanSC19]|uniref:L,D-transpeptidase family protein n=1 Tax=Streptomyces sp. PanSC19 TaxID=1520455 RepID=UPI000FBA713A|nr:Ig-like domain-containing protein [Streptomyces sp. PanSC19]ROQ32136.1 lipoprotein-anchoring transpeptidase ErfK/SrfK [Streptomyces sp. PanSC19]
MLPIRTSRPALAAVALAVSLTACSAQAASGPAGGQDPARAAAPAEVTVVDRVAGKPVTVTATGGTLTEVKVVDGEGGRLVGRTGAGGTRWASDRKAAPGTSYTVEVTSRAADGKESTSRSSFTTPEPGKVNKVTLAPGKNTTVGIGQPLSIVFDLPVTRKADVERQLKVTTSNGTEGSWGWVKDYSGRDRVDWRPREYWKPGTKVTLEADLDGTDSGGGWFVRDYRTGFTIGAAQVVKVDLDAHRLRLERDGRTVRTIPVSGGTPGGDKRSWRGTAVLMAKEGTINMNSETVGLGDAYDKDVDYSMRLTWSGMYAHAAPWNAAYFGRANRSSGCIGMSDADAAAFYSSVNVGDPFEITGRETKGVVAEGNGYGAWNLSWGAWKTKSALR